MTIKLGPIKNVSPKALKPNPINETLFSPVPGKELDQLADDIKKRGVLVPLVAKKDGTLLAGHRRLSIARTMGIDALPVQYIIGKLSRDEEMSFIIKDNLLRRHLGPEERRVLYNQVCKGFEEKVANKGSKLCGVNAKDLAEKTGLSPKTVNYDLVMIRSKKERDRISKSVVDVADEKEIFQFRKSVARIINISSLGSKRTCEDSLKIMTEATERLKIILSNIEAREKGKVRL